jgi:hypothetical protein
LNSKPGRAARDGRAAGADIDKWFQAMTFESVSGSIAQAKVSNRFFDEVWNGNEAKGDVSDMAAIGNIADIAFNQIVSTADRMALCSAHLMDKPKVWAAILALANKLPVVGKMDGGKVLSIITSVIPESDLTCMFAAASQWMGEAERVISANDVAFATLPDGSSFFIKGEKLYNAAEDKGSDEWVWFKCTSLIVAETLCRAFGDVSYSEKAA